jgi:hypothetical protein
VGPPRCPSIGPPYPRSSGAVGRTALALGRGAPSYGFPTNLWTSPGIILEGIDASSQSRIPLVAEPWSCKDRGW